MIRSIKTILLILVIMIPLTSCYISTGPKGEKYANDVEIIKQTTVSQQTKVEVVKPREEIKTDGSSSEATLKMNESVPMQVELKEVNGFVRVKDLDKSLVVDLRYASANNFTGKKVYPVDVCVLRKETAQKLVKANSELRKKGYRIKIWDAYRPLYVQQIFWDMVKDSRFVANPQNGGSRHNFGTAVDVTMVDETGKEVKMPSEFDDFSIRAYRNNSDMSNEVRQNLIILTEAMKMSGFNTIDTEWWHYEDSEHSKYTLVDIRLEQFLN